MKQAIPAVLRPYLRTTYDWALSRPLITGTAKRRLARSVIGNERALVERVSPIVSPNDSMAGGGWRHYFGVGLDAVRWIDAAIASNDQQLAPRQILDMPCGWGRVMRFLAARYPAAELVGCDIVGDGINFCAAQFGAQPVRSSPALDQVELPSKFDLIWCGSLVTHLDAASVESLLALFARSLSPSGMAIVTSHGRLVARRLRAADPFYALGPEAAAAIVSGYERDGFGYAEYPPEDTYETGSAGHHDASYGVSLASRDWMVQAASRAGLAEAYFTEQAWDAHHDVYGLMLRQ